ncbi:MAG: hypothetical protein A2033_15090 [Bacteroidetes bacterium GWA2_31_9]|nr:MAG: hypothetical protein A2033_15090 [Bacteroidetes bacterium GWA2_31_9]
MLVKLLLYAGIGNFIFSVLFLLIYRFISKKPEHRKRLRSFLFKMLLLSIFLLGIWMIIHFSNKPDNNNIQYNQILTANADTVVDFCNLKVFIPQNFLFVYRNIQGIEQFSVADKTLEELVSNNQITFLKREREYSFSIQAENIYNRATNSDSTCFYEISTNNIFYSNPNGFKKEYYINLLNKNIIGEGSVYCIESGDKVIVYNVVVYKNKNYDYFKKVNNMIKLFFENNRFDNN